MNNTVHNGDGGVTWKPISFEYLLSNYTFSSPRVYLLFSGWLILIAAALYSTALIYEKDFISVTLSRIEIVDYFVFNPAYILGILLLFWVGFEWGFIPVYLSSFFIAYVSGIEVMWATLVGLSFIMGMGFYALAYHSFRVDFSMRSLKSVVLFVVVSFLSALASSMGSFIWSFFQQLSATDMLTVWKSWWTGMFFQSIIIVGPLLYLFSRKIDEIKSTYFKLPEERNVSIKWIYGSVITVAVTLALFIFSGYQLGRINIAEIIGTQQMIASQDVMGSLEAFEIIAWTAIGLIVITGFTAIYLLANWNKTLRAEVISQTRDLLESREKLKKSLKEKDILFKELQHRVKNNLAQVHGMLELQEAMIDNDEVVKLLKVSKSRIHTMALAHEALYKNNDLTDISLKYYLEQIAEITHESFLDEGKEIELIYDIDDIHLNMSRAIPLGLMISEIMINAHKHAFNSTDKGVLKVVSKVKGKSLVLTIKDDGTGIPDEIDLSQSNSLGMMLVQSFTQQLKAKMDLKSNKTGTTFKFSIPLTSIEQS
ncbi:MAG: sensor histidine kinase [Balneolaceae bacterium]|nr:MAG: sensor histidine kinase [Balneolaceae bacterium]